MAFILQVLALQVTIGVKVNRLDVNKCFSQSYSGLECCHSPTGWSRCWEGEYTYESCCDDETKAAADALQARWRALFGAKKEDISGCLRDFAWMLEEGVAELSGYHPTVALLRFNMERAWHARRPGSKAFQDTRRFQFRIGKNHLPERCDIKALTETTASIVDDLHEGIKKSGMPVTGWAVNIGSGSFQDPMYVLALRNLSRHSVFIDPVVSQKNLLSRSLQEHGVTFIHDLAHENNLCALFEQGGLSCASPVEPRRAIDYLKIDIDSCDCAVLAAALRVVEPKVIWMEINFSFPPPLQFSRYCHPDWYSSWRTAYHNGRILSSYGCSLSQAVSQLKLAGYSLFRLSEQNNAIFIKESMAGVVGGADVDEFTCYDAALAAGKNGPFMHFSFHYIVDWISHEPTSTLAQAWCNVSLHDWLLGLSHIPYSLGM